MPAALPVAHVTIDPRTGITLPVEDPDLLGLGLRDLIKRWAAAKDLPAMAAEAMTGADRKAQALVS